MTTLSQRDIPQIWTEGTWNKMDPEHYYREFAKRIRPWQTETKIISLGYALPEHSYSQVQIFEALGYPRHFWRIFRDAGVEERHFSIPLERLRALSFQEQQEEYQRAAIELSKKAITQCLDGQDPKGVGLIVYASCTGFSPGPTIGHYLLKDMGFGDNTYVTNIGSQGCEAAFPGLLRARDFTVATGKPSLALNCELCSLTYFPEPDGKPDGENDFELLRGSAIFADGCSCALVGHDTDWRHPFLLDFEVYTDSQYIDELGYVWRNGRLRLKLSKRVPYIAPILVKTALSRLLARNQLAVGDIKHWVLHAAGVKVLENIRDSLGLKEEDLYLSKKVLSLYGNLSSATVGVVGKYLITEGNLTQGDYAVMATIGPGMSSGTSLLQFGGD